MGGNALKNYNTRRLPAKEYFDLANEFSEKFFKIFNFDINLIKSYKEKETFGDADFLVLRELLPSNWIDILRKYFNLKDEQYSKNGNVISIGYRNFQIDLIVTPKSHYDFSYFYFCYNDFGNFIGRIGHKLGIKIGIDGISISVRSNVNKDRILKDILLTTDKDYVFEILGLKKELWYSDGFNTLEDIFEYIATSKYFDPEIFYLVNRSNETRKRDMKRFSYSALIKWLETTKPKANYSFQNKDEKGGRLLIEPFYSNIILHYFPWVKDIIDEAINQDKLDTDFSKIYNGKIVSQLTGYTGKALGDFLTNMKQYIDNDIKRSWILSEDLMRLKINEIYNLNKPVYKNK